MLTRIPDEVQIVALSTAFRATIRVAYLDGHEPPVPPGRPAAAAATAAGRETSEVKFHTFENGDEGALEPLTLLYRCVLYCVRCVCGG